MGWVTDAVTPIKAIGDMFDEIFTSDEERLQAQALLEKLKQQPQIMQTHIARVEAQHRSVWVAGWRPCIGWVCGASLAVVYLVNPILEWVTGSPGPQLNPSTLTQLVTAMLGLGTLRTAEKMTGKAR